jgi:HD-GYP domain-containing protein (c-di-GMP phosphodiesterase class II)
MSECFRSHCPNKPIQAHEIDLSTRIVVVADIFTALTEDRPYREGLPRDKVSEILMDMVEKGELVGDITERLLENYEKVDSARNNAQSNSVKEYDDFREKIFNKLEELSV